MFIAIPPTATTPVLRLAPKQECSPAFPEPSGYAVDPRVISVLMATRQRSGGARRHTVTLGSPFVEDSPHSAVLDPAPTVKVPHEAGQVMPKVALSGWKPAAICAARCSAARRTGLKSPAAILNCVLVCLTGHPAP